MLMYEGKEKTRNDTERRKNERKGKGRETIPAPPLLNEVRGPRERERARERGKRRDRREGWNNPSCTQIAVRVLAANAVGQAHGP